MSAHRITRAHLVQWDPQRTLRWRFEVVDADGHAFEVTVQSNDASTPHPLWLQRSDEGRIDDELRALLSARLIASVDLWRSACVYARGDRRR